MTTTTTVISAQKTAVSSKRVFVFGIAFVS
jgi:hypothetical protein